MNFLANIYLWLLPLVSVPLLIYLFNRSNYRNYEYSSIKFLTSINKKSIKKINLLNILLLIIRTLIVLFFIFMMTRPFYNRSFGSQKDADGYALIAIDNSLSMYNNIDTKLHKTLTNIINPLNDRVKIDIVTTDNLTNIFSGYKKNFKLSQISIPKSFQNTYLEKVFNYASLLQESSLNKYLFIVSDGQLDLSANTSYTDSNLQDWSINYINLEQDELNIAVTDVYSNSNFILINNKFTINSEILNNGYSSVENHLVELYVDDINVGKQFIDLGENEKIKLSFNLSLPESGEYKCYIKSQKDNQIKDNIFYFKIHVVSSIDIDIIKDEQNIFLTNILNSFNLSSDLLNHRSFSLKNYLNEKINNNILFVIGMENFSSQLVSKLNALPEYRQFKVVVFPELKDTSFNEFSNFSDQILNQDFSRTVLKDNNYIEIDYPNINNRFIKSIFLNKVKRNIKVFNYINLDIGKETLVGLNNNNFLINRYVSNNLEFLLFSISLDLKSSNLPIKGSVIPLFKTFLSSDRVVDFISVTENINSHNKLLKSKVTSPSGQTFTFNQANGINFLSNIGFYDYTNKTTNSFFAVNYDSIELKLLHIENNELLANILPKETRIINSDDNIQDILANNIIGYEIWTYFLFLVLLLILIEMYLSTSAIKNE